jgi:hypothetical protein
VCANVLEKNLANRQSISFSSAAAAADQIRRLSQLSRRNSIMPAKKKKQLQLLLLSNERCEGFFINYFDYYYFINFIKNYFDYYFDFIRQ